MVRETKILVMVFSLVFLSVDIVYPQNNQYKFRQISTQFGLYTTRARAIYKDSRGFMWFATGGGFQRFDGYELKLFDNIMCDTNLVCVDKFCTSLLEDTVGSIWIGTLKNGLINYSMTTGDYKYYRPEKDNPGSIGCPYIGKLYKDRSGNIWVGTHTDCLYRFDRNNETFENFRPRESESNPQCNIVLSMTEDHTGRFWIGTGGGLFLFDPFDKNFTLMKPDFYIPEPLDRYWCITQDEGGKMWFGTSWGVITYEAGINNWSRIVTKNPERQNAYDENRWRHR